MWNASRGHDSILDAGVFIPNVMLIYSSVFVALLTLMLVILGGSV